MHARYLTKQMAQLMYQQKSLMRKVEEMHLLEEMVQEVKEMVHMRGKEMQEVRMEFPSPSPQSLSVPLPSSSVVPPVFF